mgnify:FL=1
MTTAHATRCTGDKLQLRSDDHTYNGWVNYETWSANLWIDQEPAWQEMIARTVLEAKKSPSGDSLGTGYDMRPYEVSEQVKDTIHEDLYEGVSEDARAPIQGLAGQLFNGAWSNIEWRDIVNYWWEMDEADLKNYAEE